MDKCKTGLGYNAVSPPYNGNFMPSTPDLVYLSLDDFIDVNQYVSEFVVKKPTVESNEPKTASKENGAPLIKDWVSEIPRKDNMYSVDLKNVVPQGGLTCLFVKATSDEFTLWHRRLGHVNVKTINKLVKGNLVRDHLGKFNGKADEGFFIGYSTNSKAFRVFNSRTRIVEENLHVKFNENTPNIAGSGPNWLFDIDALTKSINYKPIVIGNQSNGSVDPLFYASSKDSPGDGFKPSGEEEKKDVEDLGNKDNEVLSTEELRVNQEKDAHVSSTNNNIIVSPTDNVVGIKDNTVDENIVYGYVDDPNMPELENIRIFKDSNEDVFGAEADLNNLKSTFQVSHIPTTRIHKDRPLEQVIGNPHSAPQTRRMTKSVTEHEPKKALIDLPYGKRAIGTKWVYRNKKDERGIVVRNKARMVAQGHTQEEGIDYDEVFAPVARIEATRLFLAYASFKDFMVYQMDIKSAFIYEEIKEEVYVCQPPGFKDPEFPNKVYKVEKAIYGLHQAPKAWKAKSKVTKIPQSSEPPNLDADEAIHKERRDNVERAATTAASLDAERQETIGDRPAQTRFERLSKQSNDLPLSRVNILRSKDDSMKLKELMELCTKLSARIFDLEITKTAQAKEIVNLKKRVKRLERKRQSSTPGMKLFKIGTSRRRSLGKEAASKQGRNDFNDEGFDADINDVFKDVEGDAGQVISVSTDEVFTGDAVNTIGTEVNTASAPVTSADEPINTITKVVTTAEPNTPPTSTTIVIKDEDLIIAQTHMKIRSEKSKARGVVMKEPNADYELAVILQKEEREELTVEEKSRLFMGLMDKIKSILQDLKQKSREENH
nr:putative ribonuclease H-like domain-containing protein [Tanacetum cinerariifolium]